MKKVVITGTGRCGTSFLMRLLTNAGLNTGYTREEAEESINKIEGLNAGIEHSTLGETTYTSEYIKNPAWVNVEEFKKLLKHHQVRKVIIPIRDLQASAKSRELMQAKTHGGYGGFTQGVKDVQAQKVVNAMALYDFINYLEDNEIKYRVVSFHKMMKKPRYLYGKLGLGAVDVDYNLFEEEYKKILDHKKIRF